MRLELGIDVKADPTEDVTEEVTVEPMDEEEQVTAEVCRYLRRITVLLLIISFNVCTSSFCQSNGNTERRTTRRRPESCSSCNCT